MQDKAAKQQKIENLGWRPVAMCGCRVVRLWVSMSARWCLVLNRSDKQRFASLPRISNAFMPCICRILAESARASTYNQFL